MPFILVGGICLAFIVPAFFLVTHSSELVTGDVYTRKHIASCCLIHTDCSSQKLSFKAIVKVFNNFSMFALGRQ